MNDPVLHVPPHVAEERAASQVQRPVIGLLFGGWRTAVNPATIAYMEVWSTGNAFAVFATLTVTIPGKEHTPAQMQLSPPFPTEAEAERALDEIASQTVWHLATPVLWPPRIPGPVQ